ncbi:DUF4179 domain-containing protein [Bacillus sp. PS06]|uniref:DUF4179 domain-containing protein n=1 Tax=Bacillus sp. PS06 TaxID=2764176 RepID=UPI00177EC5DB|nr:DUF4179 domain-containing protein [Bacillus sp. PS06]MBD8070916.1 DUF4179 domain-containing protein [Bacillus sp. PS06]
MKDIYNYLNDVELDVNQFEEADVSEFEKKKMKKELLKKIRKAKPSRWKKALTSATISIFLLSATLFGLSLTTNAEEIPILGNIFKFFNNDGFFESYDENAKSLTITQEVNGVSVTVNEAIFDGKTLYITYTIESQLDLGESPLIDGMPNIVGEDTFIHTANHEMMKIDENTYIGVTTANLLSEEQINQGTFEFVIEKIIPNLTYGTEPIMGNWNFQFKLVATDNEVQLVDLHSEKTGIAINIKKITYTPMSFLIFYDEVISKEIRDKWDFVSTYIEVKDNLGHVYKYKHNGGYSNSETMLYLTSTFEKLNLEATSLIITPIVELSQSDGTDEYGGVYRNENSTAPIETIKLQEIVVKINK